MGNSRSGSPRDGLGFHINFPIEVTQLGLSKKALNAYFNRFKNGNVTIELIDATNREVLTMMNFGYNDLKIPSDDGFMYKMIDAENLHKGFEGLLRIRPSETWKTVDKVNLTCNIDWNHVFGDDGPIIWRSSYIGKHQLNTTIYVQTWPALLRFLAMEIPQTTLWHCIVWKNEKFTATQIFFRQINLLQISFVKR